MPVCSRRGMGMPYFPNFWPWIPSCTELLNGTQFGKCFGFVSLANQNFPKLLLSFCDISPVLLRPVLVRTTASFCWPFFSFLKTDQSYHMSTCNAEGEELAEGPGLPRLCGLFWKFQGSGYAGLGACPLCHPDIPREGKGRGAEGCLQDTVLLALLLRPQGNAAWGAACGGGAWLWVRSSWLCFQVSLDLEDWFCPLWALLPLASDFVGLSRVLICEWEL